MTDAEHGSTHAAIEPPSRVRGYYADPTLTVFDGRFYLYPTTDGVLDWGSTSFRAFSSKDLVNWADHGTILELGRDVRWADERAWAPAIARRGDRYFLYYTADFEIGVAWADSPIGPFTDLGRPLVRAGDHAGAAIDPSVFVDDDGSAYLYWGNSVANAVRLGDDMMSFDPAGVVSWTPSEFREAAWVHKRHGIYYLSWSVDDTRSEDYHVNYATGDGPLGPWTDRGTLLEKVAERGILATGHHSVTSVPGTDEWVIAYHRFAIPGGNGFHREVAFDRLHHRADGLIDRVVPSSSPLRISLTPSR